MKSTPLLYNKCKIKCNNRNKRPRELLKKLSLHFRFLLAAFLLLCQSRMCIRDFQDRRKTAQNNSRAVALIFEQLQEQMRCYTP